MVMRRLEALESFKVEYLPLLNIDIRQDSIVVLVFRKIISYNIIPVGEKINFFLKISPGICIFK